jgi:hypothetical protein
MLRRQTLWIDRGVALGRCKRSVAEQLLDDPEVGAPRKEFRREGVTKRMGRRAFGQAERGPEMAHSLLRHGG